MVEILNHLQKIVHDRTSRAFLNLNREKSLGTEPSWESKVKAGECLYFPYDSYMVPSSSSSLYIWNQALRQANISGNDRLDPWFQIYRELARWGV